MQHEMPAAWRLMQDGVVYAEFNHQGGPRGGDEFVAPNWWMGMATHAVRNIIRENQLYSLENCLQTSGKEGMTTMDNCLLDLYRKTQISYDTALSRARHPDRISRKKE